MDEKVSGQGLLYTLKEAKDIFEEIAVEVKAVNELIAGLEKTLVSNREIGYSPEDAIHAFRTIFDRAKAIRKWLHFIDEVCAEVFKEDSEHGI